MPDLVGRVRLPLVLAVSPRGSLHLPLGQGRSQIRRVYPSVFVLPSYREGLSRAVLEALAMGHKRLSAWLIVNRIRWESMVVTTGKDYKISNDYIAWYARLFINKYKFLYQGATQAARLNARLQRGPVYRRGTRSAGSRCYVAFLSLNGCPENIQPT
jgi:hypothetical protein